MKMLVIHLLNAYLIGLLGLSTIAMAHDVKDKGCHAYDRDITQELALLSHQAAAMPNALDIDIAYALTLSPQQDVLLLAEPHQLSVENASFAAIVPLALASAGKVRISVSSEAWIDVIQKSNTGTQYHVLSSTDFSGRSECATLRKLVEYDLIDGVSYFLQLTGVPSSKIKVVITAITPKR